MGRQIDNHQIGLAGSHALDPGSGLALIVQGQRLARDRQVAAVQPLSGRGLGVSIHQADAAAAGQLNRLASQIESLSTSKRTGGRTRSAAAGRRLSAVKLALARAANAVSSPTLRSALQRAASSLARADAQARKIAEGDMVKVSSNGTSVTLRARIARDVPPGAVRIPRDDAVGLHELVEVSK